MSTVCYLHYDDNGKEGYKKLNELGINIDHSILSKNEGADE